MFKLDRTLRMLTIPRRFCSAEKLELLSHSVPEVENCFLSCALGLLKTYVG